MRGVQALARRPIYPNGMQTAVIVLAAGRGERLGGKTPKAFVDLAGKTLLQRTLDNLLQFSGFGWLQPVLSASDLSLYAERVSSGDPRVARPVIGGAERQDSVAAGLAAIPEEFELIAIHDAARCRVSAGDVARVVEVAERSGAAVLAAPCRDTVKLVEDGVVTTTPRRDRCWLAQTPQVFHRSLFAEALAKAQAEDFQGTDDAQLVERLGAPVQVVEGSPGNFKITVPEDLALAARLLALEEAGP